jgi:hypothetical protein
VALEHLRGPIAALLHPAPEHRSEGFAHGCYPFISGGLPDSITPCMTRREKSLDDSNAAR